MLNYTNTSTLYISQADGNDAFSGYTPVADEKGNGPIRTLKRLEELLCTMRSCGVLQPVTVRFMGDFYLDKPLELGFDLASNFFANSHPMKNITFESYGTAKARLIGGRKLTGFQKSAFRGIDCLALFLPEVKEGKWHFTDLYVNGKRADAARYPKTGTLKGVTTELPETTRKLFEGSKWFIARTEDLKEIEGIENATVSFYHYWIDEHSPVESYDPAHCSLTELGGGGIKVYGRSHTEAAELATSHCVIRNNLIRGCGRRYAASCGILINHSAHNEISDNEVCYLDYTGISAGWVWGYHPSTTYGNLIHDVNSAHYGGWGIYTDEGSSYITVENNVVYNCKSNCYHQHYGSYNTVRDNVFACSGEALVKISRRENHLGLLLEHNTLIANGTCMYSCSNETAPFATLQTSHNCYWDISGRAPVMYEGSRPLSLDVWQNLYGLDEGSCVEAPTQQILGRLPAGLS